jgi:hypothetical protein
MLWIITWKRPEDLILRPFYRLNRDNDPGCRHSASDANRRVSQNH